MATMEKPNKEKNRKTKFKQKTVIPNAHEEKDDDETAPATTVAAYHNEETPSSAATTTTAPPLQEQRRSSEATVLEAFENLATKNSNEIVSHECYISNDYPKENIEEIATTTTTLYDELQQASATAPTTEENELQITEPSAPPVADVAISVVPSVAPVIVQYPNLEPMQHIEQTANVVYREQRNRSPGFTLLRGELKPLTADELKEIYHCAELELVKQFELEYLMNSLLETYENDALYMALREYYEIQGKLSMNMHDVQQLRKLSLEKQQVIWTRESVTKSFSGTCGDSNVVYASVDYDIIKVNNTNLEAATVTLSALFDMVCYTYNTNQINAKVTKVKIDELVNQIIVYPKTAPQYTVVALQQKLNAETLEIVANLRRAISILFSFARQVSPNDQFDADLKHWLRKLISLHLLLSTKEDHWFLLFNILRCPNGVGAWAAEFLQIPLGKSNQTSASHTPSGARPSEVPLQLNSPEMNHCIAVLQILLLPIKKRNEYLKAFTKSRRNVSDPINDERWILVDSDGEDSHTPTGDYVGLKESDLIALLHQIPFEKLFTSVLNIEKFLDDYIIEPDLISARQMLTVIAFFSKLIDLLGDGMITYNTERYKQLAKRLGRLIRHTLQYVSDYHELFLNNNLSKDARLIERIEVELNVLLIKACSYIYRTRNLATWQYFSSLPFHTLDADSIWQIFYYLNVGFPTQLPAVYEDPIELFNAPDFWTKFNIANADVSAEDLYYLLQTFFEMANERDRTKDWDLIKEICLHIFNIGFINPKTRDECYKTSRDMLVNITLAYEDLMSCLLLQLKIRCGEIENATYLFKSLPLENWKPGMDSFEILSNWLLHYDFKSQENMLARIIISHLNWGFDCDGRLFLPHNIHVRMACLISDALTKHAPEVIGLSGISESVRQVSNLIDFTQSTKEQFTCWCWSMVSMLRLHLMDQGVESIKRTLQNPTQPLLFIPELERVDLIWQGINENRPLSIYVGILVSLHGHSVPLICQKGFELMKLLLNDHRHAAVIRCLELIVPLFLETPETLANCESFHSILNTILNADKTYLKMAKDMIYPNAIGPVLELFDNMIHHQIISYTNYGLCSPLNLLNVWLNCFTALPNWQQSNVLYLLDKILCIAYQFPDCRVQAVEFLYNYYKDCEDWKGTNKLSAFKTLFSSAPTSRVPQLAPNQCWLALVLLEIEFRTQDSNIWSEFLRQLASNECRNNLEAALKKTFAVVKTNAFPAQMLVIYKYATLIANMDIAHPLFPIIIQKFFELYLYRVPLEYNDHSFQNVYGVSDKFYEYNVTLMKKIKTNLKAAELNYENEATKNVDNESLGYFYRNCAKLMKTYALWLEETNINKFSSDEQNFPAQYNNEKLHDILNGYTSHWTEYISPSHIRQDQRHQSDQWARKCFRFSTSKQLRSPLQPKPKQTPIQRMKSHLASYDKGIEPPTYIEPMINIYKEVTKNTSKQLEDKIKVLNSTATKFHYKTSELNSLNRNYLDIVLELYQMVPYNELRTKTCNSLLFNRECKSAARIQVTLEHIRKNDEIERKINNYRERHDKIIDEMLSLNVEEFAQAIEQLGGLMRSLLTTQLSQASNQLRSKTGVDFFYHIVKNMTDITMKFTPTHDLYTQILGELGIFIQDNQEQQGLEILQLALKRHDLIKVLSGVFVPYRTTPENFLKMYKFLIDSHLKRCDTKILFVLLSKFDLVCWLDSYKPKSYDITQLLLLVLQGLESWSQPDSSLLQDQFRRQLVHIFDYNFPQQYGEVLQAVLDRVSDQKLMPDVLLDLMNTLLNSASCEAIGLQATDTQINELAEKFAQNQQLFNLKTATDTIMLFARHFQKERLHHGLHGLYPKHKNYCVPLSIWFNCFGHLIVAQAVTTYQELLADQISDVVFGSIIEMYSPWLITYTEQTMQQAATANWIRQLMENGKMLYPWSDQHKSTSTIIIMRFIKTLKYILEYLPSSNKMLEHTFSWYVHHFAIAPQMELYVLSPIHEGLAMLPWERFRPLKQHIDLLYDSLLKCIPMVHAMLGHIFIRIDWNAWFANTLPTITPHDVQTECVSRLFTIFVKIAFEPNIHIHINTSKILEEAINYPWYIVEYNELEQLLKWFVVSVEPSIVLKLRSESNYADRAVLELLRLSCAMMPERATAQPISNTVAKRMLYTRSFVRLHRACAAKNKKLFDTKGGKQAFNIAFMELLQAMDHAISATVPERTLEEQRREALNLMIEIVAPMQTQSEETSNIHIETLIQYQKISQPANALMCATLPAIGHMNTYISGIYLLLEVSIESYFRTSDATREWHTPTWRNLFSALQMSLAKLELMPIMHGGHFFTLHVFVLYKLEEIENVGDKITFLQDLTQLVESLKTSPHTEPYLALVWGLIISRGAKLLSTSEHVKKPLLMLARHLQIASTQAEGWGDGLLGAIGLKKDIVTNKRKVLTRCLACIVFSLFPNSSLNGVPAPCEEFQSALRELSMLLANKKFNDVKQLIVKVVSILNEHKTPAPRDVPHLTCRLIDIFYNFEYLTTIPEVWDFDFKLK